MSRPDSTEITPFAQATYDYLTPVQFAEEETAVDYSLLKFMCAIAQMFNDSDELAHSLGGVPWSALIDINRIPDVGLIWFGQFIGVSVNPSASYADQRQQIREHSGWNRGRVQTLIIELRKVMGDVLFQIRERSPGGHPDKFEVVAYQAAGDYQYIYDNNATYNITYTNFPSYEVIFQAGDVDEIEAVIKANKPAGDIATYRIAIDLSDWNAGTVPMIYLVGKRTYKNIYNIYESYSDLLLANTNY